MESLSVKARPQFFDEKHFGNEANFPRYFLRTRNWSSLRRVLSPCTFKRYLPIILERKAFFMKEFNVRTC